VRKYVPHPEHPKNAKHIMHIKLLHILKSGTAFISNWPNARTERRGRPSASTLATDAARPRSLQ
jgi:hypothetical protein